MSSPRNQQTNYNDSLTPYTQVIPSSLPLEYKYTFDCGQGCLAVQDSYKGLGKIALIGGCVTACLPTFAAVLGGATLDVLTCTKFKVKLNSLPEKAQEQVSIVDELPGFTTVLGGGTAVVTAIPGALAAGAVGAVVKTFCLPCTFFGGAVRKEVFVMEYPPAQQSMDGDSPYPDSPKP